MSLLTDTKDYLRVDGTDNDTIISSLILAAQQQIEIATGISVSQQESNHLAVVAIYNIVKLMYEADLDNNEKILRLINNILGTLQNAGLSNA